LRWRHLLAPSVPDVLLGHGHCRVAQLIANLQCIFARFRLVGVCPGALVRGGPRHRSALPKESFFCLYGFLEGGDCLGNSADKGRRWNVRLVAIYDMNRWEVSSEHTRQIWRKEICDVLGETGETLVAPE
jgi:hypothetical protein